MTDVGNMRARTRRILWFAARHLAQTWWYELFLPRVGLARVAARNRSARLQRIAQRFHVLAVDLGGLMIKVGQFMSSRLDVLPPEITKELEGLQDEVPPVPFPEIRTLAEAELGVTLERAFSFIDPTPVAAASLGQVHRARLSETDAADTGLLDVVVKIQRPGIRTIVDVDLSALRRVARWLSHIRLVSDRVDVPALVEEFAVTSLEEIDYLHEAANAERFAQSFAGDARVGVPDLVWERTTRRVLTLQDVTAIKINDVDGLRAAGIDPAEVATEFAAVMFDQLFVHGYFHADPHPGNIFVTPLRDAGVPGAGGSRGWKFTFIDFGMMGDVPDALREGLRKLLIAAASRNGKGMVDGIREVGVLLPSADTAELERAMTKLFARFGGMGFAELQDVDPREFRAFALEFGDVVRSLPFQLPENFLLIVRAMSLTSGMCSSLDPAFNIWNSVEPYSAQLIRAEGGNLVQTVAKEAMSAAGIIARLPQRLDNLTTRIEEGTVSVQTPRLERRLADLERTGRRIVSAILFAALLIGGILLRAEDAVIGTVLIAVSALPLLHALFARILARRGPLP
ncbi:Predicted unusual protein kinase regulating ubiquinone biosynthesis, AarF/ABC1/UbiB family [Cryobacterium psychrotolerans]|uniref:Predicted unusual protein kinase regulating ubiquinone biosynthesis, AarF/ABC1/UbiB family n=1 Tax=Cryobacterium psychrotolerans TaxID=386301 RepID=A0A1G9FTE9_9MICO|nr:MULTISPECIES: AarF/UbiB family protein [Cryobacterium]TFD47117.1 AarF/ABC1/UbiB kinase family protein [Cryobacterium sp. TMT1-2-1]TFD90604.1 AarF/ABC1/UbiB kinase family protein [Cryobacterium psychrotolerans]SDK91615.1 Predicted unusual protein kinase regulating ubiquinone biosynthesis, AarF/ABC1/UbiB family [Cryobacterium psychrotolerans]